MNVIDQNEDVGGDFTGDGIYNCFDVDALVAQIVIGTNSPFFDLTGDKLVNDVDLDQWLANAGSVNLASGNAYLRGDANLDGKVSSTDLNRLALNWQQSVSGWCAADFTADGEVNSADLNQLALNWQHDASAAALAVQPARVPRAPLGQAADAVGRPNRRTEDLYYDRHSTDANFIGLAHQLTWKRPTQYYDRFARQTGQHVEPRPLRDTLEKRPVDVTVLDTFFSHNLFE